MYVQVYRLRYYPYDGKLPLEKWLGKNVRKVTLFNCFGNVLASVIDQLGEFDFCNLELSLSALSKDDLWV